METRARRWLENGWKPKLVWKLVYTTALSPTIWFRAGENCNIWTVYSTAFLSLPHTHTLCRPSQSACKTERIEWFYWLIEDQAFLRSHNSAPRPPPPPLSVSKLSLFLILPVCRRSSLLTGGGGRGRVWSRIIRPQESLGLYKSFKPLWCKPTCVWHDKSNGGHETIFLITYRYTTYGNQSQNA